MHSYFPRLVFMGWLVVLSFGSLLAQQPLDNAEVIGREQHPILRADAQELFFTRSEHPSNQGKDNAADIWVRPRNPDGSWGRPINPGSPVNSFAHDRPLALNADGTRLVVLRSGLTKYIDLLERNERNWRVVNSWPLPEGVYPRLDVTFELNSQRLVYSTYSKNGSLDLYERRALPNGKWSVATSLTRLNSAESETEPQFAADGRTLYFRQGEQWKKQNAPETVAKRTSIPARVRHFSVGTNQEEVTVIVYNDLGNEERLLVQQLAKNDLPEVCRLVRGYLAAPPAPGSSTALARLTNGESLEVFPDALLRYELFLRANEALLTNGDNATAANSTGGASVSYVTLGGNAVNDTEDRIRLQQGIASREAALNRLDAERRKYDLAIPKETDPELDALRSRYLEVSGVLDTLPPGSNSVRNKYARDLKELERMKEKFRRQQEEKLRERSGSRNHSWTAKSAVPQTATSGKNIGAKTPQQQTTVPSIGESYTPLNPVDARQQAAQVRADSLRLDATIRSGLYPDRNPAVYEREAWENTVRNDLPRTEPLSPEESARLDAEYQRQQAELAALKAQLQRLNATTPAAPPVNNDKWSAKGEATPAPVDYGRTPATPVPATPPRNVTAAKSSTPGVAAGISFIKNTAYPDGAGYVGLDQLVKQLKDRSQPLEVRVHTAAKLDRRAAQLLSEERAKSIQDYLVEQGVPARMFTVIGFGNNLTGSGGERVELLR